MEGPGSGGEHGTDSDDDEDHFGNGEDDNDDNSWLKDLPPQPNPSHPPPPSIEIYSHRLKRRMELIREMRTAYLRDIVLMKQFLSELFPNDEERSLLCQQYEQSLPSLDLHKYFLTLPHERSLNIIPCHTCGGTVEIVHHDCQEIQKLTEQLQNLDRSKSDYRLVIATKTALVDELEDKLKRLEKKFREEVQSCTPPPSLPACLPPFTQLLISLDRKLCWRQRSKI